MTAIHRRVAACRAGADPTLVARLDSGWIVMGDPQVIAGYCLLLPDPVVPDLNALPPAGQVAFLADMARLGGALRDLTGAVRINYAIFGNLEPALHAHVFPRREAEPASLGDSYRVEVRIVIWQDPSAVKVPVGALFRRGDDWAVFVVNEGRVQLQPVHIGQRNDRDGQVVKGLSEGQTVVVHPPDTLTDGARVRVR